MATGTDAWRQDRARSVRDRDSGLTLVELVVAAGLVSLAVALALGAYEGARRTVASTHALAERQQAARVALDRLRRDLKHAGFNVNPDGNPLRPDESIEGAWATAVVVRSDRDAYTPEAFTPEADLAGEGAFDTVSTGNDEIFGYFLAKPDGTGTGRLRFVVDVVPEPRDGLVETVHVRNVDLSGADPPYTLYRFVLQRGSGAVRRSPLIDGVRSLRFAYLDRAGRGLAPPGGSDADPEKRMRGLIRRIRIEIDVTGAKSSCEVAPRNLFAAPGSSTAGPAGEGTR